MKALVTGATGFIGTQLTRLLGAAGHDVYALGRSEPASAASEALHGRMHFIRADLTSGESLPALVASIRPEICFHLAWIAEPGRYLEAPENIDLLAGSAQLARALADSGCLAFVGVGTCFEYDTRRGLLRENDTISPRSLYAACKASFSLLLERIGAASGMRTTWARLFYLYGPAEDERRLVASVITSLLRGNDAKATAGTQVRDYLHVMDVARALLAIGLSGVSGPINVASGVPVLVRDLVNEIGRLTGRPERVLLGALPERIGDPAFICADVTRLRSEVGWTPSFTLVEGLRDSIGWWKDRLAT